MPYRSPPAKAKTGKRVQVRSYLDLVAAELARVQLEGQGIASSVVQTASFNPLLVAATGGHLLLVDETDGERADEVLRRVELVVDEGPDNEPEGTLRCPRCESAYCRFGRVPLRVQAGDPLVAAIAMPFWFLSPSRWYCERCEHVWNDAHAGRRAPTPQSPDDPRPVFLLWRGHAGAGAFFGGLAGVVALVVLGGSLAAFALFALTTFVGWYFGRVVGKFVCSQPGCRAELARDAETCPRCRGSVAGPIRSATAHFAAVADFRRELEASREASARKKARKALRAAPSR